jgi:hypothetical protein
MTAMGVISKFAILRLTGPHDRLIVGFTYASADRFPVRRNLIEFRDNPILICVEKFI